MRVWMPFVGFVDTEESAATLVTAEVALLTIREGQLCVLLAQRTQQPFRGAWSLPGAPLLPKGDLDNTVSEVLRHQGMQPRGVELRQLRTYSDVKRDPGSRRVSTLYLAVGAELDPQPVTGKDAAVVRWVPVNVALSSGFKLAYDHDRLLRDAVEELADLLEDTTIALELVPEEFTIAEVREVYQIVWGESLDARNFHRKLTSLEGVLRETGATTNRGGGRPAAVYRAGSVTKLYPPIVRDA